MQKIDSIATVYFIIIYINENLLNAKNAYRKKHNLLTSNEIVDIRKKI